MIICLGLSLPTGSSGLSRDAAGNRIFCPLFGLAPDGVYMAIPVAWMPVGPYLTFPPLRIKSFLFMRGISLLHCPWSHLHWVLPSTLPCGARTFLVCLQAAAIICLTHFIFLFRNFMIAYYENCVNWKPIPDQTKSCRNSRIQQFAYHP